MDSRRRENKKQREMPKRLRCLTACLVALALLLTNMGGVSNTVWAASGGTSKGIKITNVPGKRKIMYAGSSFALKANGKVKSYASSRPSVVDVDKSGVMYAKTKGNAQITITGANGTKAQIKVTVKNAAYYRISKNAGTYSAAIDVEIKAKKGYKVYYTTSGKFKTGRVIKSGKKKTISVEKTTTVSVYAVKKTAKVSARQLNMAAKRHRYAYYVQYKYTIDKNENDDSDKVDKTESISTEEAGTEETETESGSTEEAGTEETETESGSTEEIGTEETETEGGSTEEAGTEETETESESTEIRSEEEIAILSKINAAVAAISINVPKEMTVSPARIESDTPQIALSSAGMTSMNLDSDAVICSENETFRTLTIRQAGTYVISGGTRQEPLTNFVIAVEDNISEEVNLIWDHLVINNSAMGAIQEENVPVFSVGKSTEAVNITLKGVSVITGNGSYTGSPVAIICAENNGNILTFQAYDGDDTAGLTVIDAMDSAMDFGNEDPADGIYSKGTLILNSGNIQVTSNGECLKGTGKGGSGGIFVNGGTYTLRSDLGGALKSKNGVIAVKAGNITSTYTAGDSIQAKNYDVVITGGTITIDHCYGDGIQGENVTISGEDTVLDIKTYFENAGINYYNTSLGSGNYNMLTTNESTKKEVVNVDTGSHKGIKGGTKACTYSYESVGDASSYTAGETYTKEASGGIVITGGTITIDTTNTGIKYNGGMGGSQGGFDRPGNQGDMGRENSGNGNLSAANSDGQYIIGSPDDAIHSNHTCIITGGTITIASSDDGITAPDSMMLLNECEITINQCYEGIEGGEILIGASKGSKIAPDIKIYSDDDGLNAASDASVAYVYADESEEQYTKTRVSSKDNIFQMLDGYLNIMIGDDQTHSFSLATADGTATTGTYSSDGDGIDCNGSFYAYGGTIVVYGSNSGSNSPIDTDDIYYIGSGVTLLAVGGLGMTETPDTAKQAVITYPSSGNMGAFGRPGQNMGGGSSSSFSANTAFAIINENNQTILAIQPIKSYGYVLYSSPDLLSGVSYQLYSGGGVSGSLVHTDAWDYRYTEYSMSGASSLGAMTAR